VDCGRMPLRDDLRVVPHRSLECLFNVLMIMRRIVLESSTIKKRMLIS
jgi:hypothetical protein